jgi:hypothetical protein
MTVVLASVAFWTHAKLVLPGDFGKKTEVNFDVRFGRLKSSERKLLNLRLTLGRLGTEALLAALRGADDLAPEWRQRVQDATTPEAEAALAKDFRITDKEFLDQVLVDWKVQDLQGNTVPYTPANREALFEDWEGMEAATVVAYFDAFKDAPAAAKNSEELSATS